MPIKGLGELLHKYFEIKHQKLLMDTTTIHFN